MDPSKTVQAIRRILVIDDEATPRKLLALALRQCGYEVDTLESAVGLDKVFQKAEYELVLTDLRMPQVDGLEVVRWVQDHSAMTLVIVVTGISDTETAVEAMKTGAIDYITKPFQPDVVLLSVQRASELYRLRAENQHYRESLEELVEKRTEQLHHFADALGLKNKMIVETNKKLSEANDKLQQFLNQAMITDKVTTIGLLSSMLIHGIANPLGVISGVLEVMEKRFTADTVSSREVALMREHMSQVLTLVNQVRSYARTELVQFERVDVTEAIHNVVALFTLLGRTKNVDIRTELPSQPLWVNGNRSQIEQVLANLVQNGVDAVSSDGWIKVTGRSERGRIIMEVIDNGPGITVENQRKLFKMFFTTKSGTAGTGLGLFICNEIVSHHNGLISIDSLSSNGTRVIVDLPQV